MALGLGALIALALSLVLWGMQAQIAGAVLGTGRVEMASHSTTVQHPVGGVVTEILVRNGDLVQAGQVVLRLEDRQIRSDLAVVEDDLLEALANIARNEAVIDGTPRLHPDAFLAERAAASDKVRTMVDRQQRQLDSQLQALEAEGRLIGQQIAQVNDQIAGNAAELASGLAQTEFTLRELEQIRKLSEKGLSTTQQLFGLEKDLVRLQGDTARLQARAAELRARVAELELSLQGLRPEALEKAATELSKLRPDRTRHQEKRSSLLDALARTEIRAPVGGRVHDSRVQGLRSVVVAASPLMSIVPADDPLVAVVRVDAADIDQLHPGQDAALRFLAFDRRSLPVILGQVDGISPDSFVDPASKAAYYEVTVALPPDQLALLQGQELVPGMPVEAHIATTPRTPLDYVLRPLTSYFDRALRDG